MGLDVRDEENPFGTTAFVTYGDGTTHNFAMPEEDAFWGLTSDALITTIHFGLPDGGTSTDGQRFNMDNLTIGAIVTTDFNGDGVLNCTDIDALVAEIAAGTNISLFDLTGDGLVDIADLDQRRVQGGAANLPSGNPYLPGDANLDGFVDVSDFNIWNSHRLSQIAGLVLG